jgi:hypothetical protein
MPRFYGTYELLILDAPSDSPYVNVETYLASNPARICSGRCERLNGFGNARHAVALLAVGVEAPLPTPCLGDFALLPSACRQPLDAPHPVRTDQGRSRERARESSASNPARICSGRCERLNGFGNARHAVALLAVGVLWHVRVVDPRRAERLAVRQRRDVPRATAVGV